MSPVQLGWSDLRGYAPEKLWDTGDFHYRGAATNLTNAIQQYSTQIIGLPEMRKTRALVVEDQLGDDHDFSANDGESGGAQAADRQLNIRAILKVFGMYPVDDLATPPSAKRGLYGHYMLSPHIRVILLDGETLDRSLGNTTDSPSKTFLGSPQDQWLRSLLTDSTQPALNILVCGKARLGPDMVDPGSDPTGKDSDKIWSYPIWRASLVDFIRSNDIPAVWMGRDRHAVGWADKDDSHPLKPFPLLLGSGWAQDSLGSRGATGSAPPNRRNSINTTRPASTSAPSSCNTCAAQSRMTTKAPSP